ncbi:hypothetical protein J8L88_07660 [Aquimarina sp. MMG015]|uniref:lysine 2,3-aminomutase n=1 Tax=unclassified Aquimarina TaxID=2627091 RepID=UPI000E528642|nr:MULTISPECIES: lysine 2,3-aminomutase [unclassified Aquimarina]AXT56700.1 lysine 2,3-aminomutase [Aquimarina sp. AD1]MBQ4802719.1 hypothetical protein [Aquimarina sp. MMG015]RKN04705.1 lysine 2,3-aminomutase [Aquimarina sp. AD1]
MEFKSYHSKAFKQTIYFEKLPHEEQVTFNALANVFHFKVNNYVLEKLIDWDNIPNDPMYKLVFPRKEMLPEEDYEKLLRILSKGKKEELNDFAKALKLKMFPEINYHQSCIPIYKGNLVKGAYRVFNTSLALYPSPMVRTCHSYCTYCFRWVAFNDTEMQNSSSYIEPEYPIDYIKEQPEIQEVVFSGADPLVLKASTIKKYIDPILEINSVKIISITTKSIAWWPYRYLTDPDIDELFELFTYIKSKGKHLNIIAHFTHIRELENEIVQQAIRNINTTGAVIRCQGPLVNGINDTAKDWSNLWTKQIELGLIPFYMLMEADHNKESCFRIPLAEAYTIFNEAQKLSSGMARTVRGPVFVNDIHRILLDGITELNGEKYFVLKSLQSPPETNGEGKIKLIPFDEHTKDAGDLFELFKEDKLEVSSVY